MPSRLFSSRAVVLFLATCVFLAGTACGQEDSSKPTALTIEEARQIISKRLRFSDGLEGRFASFDALTSLSPEVAEVLVQQQGGISFNALTELTPETAAVLAKHPASNAFGYADLRLDGLKTISAAAAEALAAHQGKVLLLGLERLDSLPLAQKLARQWGELRLEVKELSPEIAAELAKHRGNEGDKTRPGVVIRRQDGAASILRLDGLESISLETAQALAGHEGVLVLNGLVSLEPQVAAELAKRTGNSKTKRAGTLVLNGLTSLSKEAAAALAAFPGELVLKAIPELSPEAAAALARHPGRLHLTGLERLTAETQSALQPHKNLLLPYPLPPNAGK